MNVSLTALKAIIYMEIYFKTAIALYADNTDRWYYKLIV